MLNLQTEANRISAIKGVDSKKKALLGQYFTPSSICEFMSSLFSQINGEVRLLDPGAGIGSLFTSFFEEAIYRGEVKSIKVDAFEVDNEVLGYLKSTKNLCLNQFSNSEINIINKDFILNRDNKFKGYTHVIMNPPYKKIPNSSQYRKALREEGIETGNLYSAFIAIALNLLKDKGELVAIVPRSFTNGMYFESFRKLILKTSSIKQIHLFNRRNAAFSEESVLQENIIIHLVKNVPQRDVVITSSNDTSFIRDEDSGTIITEDLTTRKIPFSKVVKDSDYQKIIHIAPNQSQQKIIDRLSVFTSTLKDVGIQVSTGPVVDFRHKEDLIKNHTTNSHPLLYPNHLKSEVKWPIEFKKHNSIRLSEKTKPYLWINNGFYLLIRRFSSKEEKRRIVATIYDSNLKSRFIGFDNKLNVFHSNKEGLSALQARGLYVYLNSSLVDQYYRLFGGNTQVNANDLRALHYPNLETLEEIGSKFTSNSIPQEKIDSILSDQINRMVDVNTSDSDPLNVQKKIESTIRILKDLGLPRAQQNERSALTLLSLIDLKPNDDWSDISNRPLLGVTPIMDWVREHYGKEYAPNTRETFRRQTLHQFVDAGLILYNPDKPDRPVNSPKACYQITKELFNQLKSFGSNTWTNSLGEYLKVRETLVQQYAMSRDMQMIPLKVDTSNEIKLTPGEHSLLIKAIVEDFGPRFVPGAELIYVGDTGQKVGFFKKDRFADLGLDLNKKGKMPDVILYYEKKGWLLLIESVTSHGPVDGKRYNELNFLFSDGNADLVFVTAFPNRKIMNKYLSDISWETEVWIADSPTHMIHFNGDKFLGPYKPSK